MRFRELLEYKRDITATNYKDKLWDVMSRDRSMSYSQTKDGATDEDIDTAVDLVLADIEDADPTPNKQYTQWILRSYINGWIRSMEDVKSTTADMLEKYHKLKVHRKLPQSLADIGKFKTQGQIIDLDHSVRATYNEFVKDRPEAMPKGNSEEVLNNKEVRVIIPEDQKAACYYGQGTRWCTAAKNNNRFDYYASNSNGPLFIVIPKNPNHEGEKYQLHFESGQYMNEEDKDQDLSWLLGERFTSKSTINYFFNIDKEAFNSIGFLLSEPECFADIVQAIRKQIEQLLLEIKFDQQFNDDQYHEWLERQGYIDYDVDNTTDYYRSNIIGNTDIPDYYTYNKKAEQLHNIFLIKLNVIKDDLFFYELNNHNIQELPSVVADILKEAKSYNFGNNYKSINVAADEIINELKKYTVDINRGNNIDILGWTLSYTSQSKNKEKIYKKKVDKKIYKKKVDKKIYKKNEI